MAAGKCELLKAAVYQGCCFVGFGISLPELATSLAAVSSGVSGQHDVVLGSIIGSNITN